MRRNWLGSFNRTRLSQTRVPDRRRRLRFESLESREVPSTVTLTSGLLTYTATTGSSINNVVSVTISSGNFVLGDTAEFINTSISGSTGSGTNSVNIPTTGVTAIELDLGDGANTINASGGVSITTQSLTITNVGGSLTVSGGVVTTGGNILIVSDNAIALNANVNAGTGTIAISANQDGAGSESLTQNATAATSTITTTNPTANAVQIKVNTSSGGTGNASLRTIAATSGTLTVQSFGGSILYAGTDSLTTAESATATLQTGISGPVSGGAAPTGTINAKGYALSTSSSGTGSIGTAARPINTNSAASNTVSLTAGSGGAYFIDWGNPIALTGAIATGAGNIVVDSANAGGHNLAINGNVSTGSGNIVLVADDDFSVASTATIGGSGFSGDVYLTCNRDNGNGENLTMSGTILSSNTTASAVIIEGFHTAGNGTDSGSVIVNNITVGNGGTITVSTVPASQPTGQGSIAASGASSQLNAGVNGTVKFIATTMAGNAAQTAAVGTSATPMKVTAGNVIVTAKAGTSGTLSVQPASVFVSDSIAGNFTTTISSTTPAGVVSLATTSGALTINGATSTADGSPINLNGAGGVVVNAQLGSAASGAIGITGALSGSSNIVLGSGGLTVNQSTDSTYGGAINGSQGLTKTGTGNLILSVAQPFSGATAVNGGTLTLGGSLTASSGVNVGASGTLASTAVSTTGPVAVNGVLSPGGSSVASMSTGNLSFGSGGIMTVNLNGATTPGTDYDQINVTGTVVVSNATLRILVGSSPTLNVGDQFTIVANDGADAVNGPFVNGATIAAFDNPLYKFTANYAGGDGNDIVLTLTDIVPPLFLDVTGGNTISYVTGTSIDSNLSVAVSGGKYIVTDLPSAPNSSDVIGLSSNAIAAGWTGGGTSTVTGPTTGITSFQVDLSDDNDTIGDLNAGTAALSINSSPTLNTAAMLTTTGKITSTGNVTFTNSSVLNLGGDVSPAGNVTDSGVTAINVTGLVNPGGTIKFTAPEITSTATGTLDAGTIQLAASNYIGTSSNSVLTQGTTISASAGAGGIFLSEADGGNVTAVATGAGAISIANGSGTLNLTATSASGNITATSASGTLNIAGTTNSTSGNISLSSGDSVTLGANLVAGSGTIAIAANTDGVGSDDFDQKGATITTGSASTNALSITVNTAGGGTGDAVIGQGSIGGESGGTATIASNGGNILWSNDPSYTAFTASQTGLANGGSNTQTLKAIAYNFTTGSTGSAGTDARPLQIDNFGVNSAASSVPNLVASVGSGGLYVTDWDNAATHDLTTGALSASGAGNIRVVAANASGHDLWVRGNVSTGSGNIFLAADDNVDVGANIVIGGNGFSGTVWMQANRDQATAGQPFNMDPTSSIVTSNTSNVATASHNQSTQAVYLDISGDQGTPSAMTVANITTGNGGRIVIDAIPNGIAAEAGEISMASASDSLNAGTNGTVELIASISATTIANSIGSPTTPIQVAGGNAVVENNFGNVYVTGAADTNFSVATTASVASQTAPSTISLATSAGVLTVGCPVTSVNGGQTTLTSTGTNGGIAIDATLGTSNIAINAGDNHAVLNTTMNLALNQTLAVTAANGLEVGPTGNLSGTGAATNTAAISGQSGGTVSPGGTGVGTLNVGNTSLAAGSKLLIDVNSSASADSLNVTGTADITNSRLEIFVNGTINVGDTFTILANDGSDATVGQFVGGTTITATNDPRYVFTINYNPSGSNDVTATLASFATTDALGVDSDGLATFASADNLNNDVTVTQAGGNYSITDTADTIALTPDATAAGWMGDGTNTVTGPVSGVTGLSFTLNSGTDAFEGVNAGSVPVTISGTGSVTLNGLISTTSNITIAGVTDILGAGTLQGDALNLSASNGIGSFVQRLSTAGTSIVASAGNGGIMLSELDGADFTATTTGSGNIDILNNAGTLNIAGATSTAGGNITLSSPDAVTLSANLNAGSGTISIAANTDGTGNQGYDQKGAAIFTTNSSPNAVTITVNAAAGGIGDAVIGGGEIGSNSGGAITVNSNGGNILWSNDPAYTAFTASQTGLSNGGSNTQTLVAYAYNLTTTASAGSVGTNDRPLQIDNFGSNDTVNSDANLTVSAGTGGAYVTDWGAAGDDLTTGTITAQGAGNIRVVTANAGAHNLWVAGQITTGSGTISLYSDDELTIMGTGVVGGNGFSGLVDLIANRDAGNGQSINMEAGATIATSNSTANAISLVAISGTGSTGLSDLSPQGGVVLGNVTAGDGATITINGAGGTSTTRQGIIVQREGTVDAGPDGTVVLIARQSDTTATTNPLATGNIGYDGDTTTLTPHPIVVRAGTVIATTNGTNLTNTGNIDVIDTIAGNFTATTAGNSAAKITLLTQAGALTIAGATSDAGGPVSLTGASGVAVNAQLGSSSTGAISITGPLSGSGNFVLGTGGLTVAQDADSHYDGVISGSQSLTKAGAGALTLTGANLYSGGTTISAGQLLVANGSGSATGSGTVTVADGATLSGSGTVSGSVSVSGTVAPSSGAAGGTGVLNVGGLSFAGSGVQTVSIDLNGTTAGAGYDQINVTGAVDLTGATLDLNIGGGFQPLLKPPFVILANDGTDAITGTFAGLSDPSTFDKGNRTFEIYYSGTDGGNDGNDVTIQVTHITSGPPVNTVPGDQDGLEDTPVVFSNANANAISVADPDFGGPLQITLSATHGVLTLANVNGLNFSAGDGAADATMKFGGLPADINTALDGLQFVPDANYNGAASVSIMSSDQGGTGDAPQTDSDSVNINLTAVNDPPSFTKGGDQLILEDVGPQTVNGWATNISAGPPDESGQALTFLISTDNDALFSAGPAIDASGNLTYTTAPDANGSATVTVRLMDNGGTANGGSDTSDPQTFTIDVTPVNDPPTFTKGSDVTVNEDAGAQALNGWATSVSAGAANESGQVLTFHVSTDNDALFSTPPTIDVSGNLTFMSAPDANGSATVSVYLTDDGGTANGGSDSSGTQAFSITVNSVNDPPSFTKGGDQSILEDAGPQTVNGWATNLSAGPADESGQHLTFLVGTDNDTLFAVKPAIDASGKLIYTTAPNANGSATVTVRLMDDGGTANGGVDTSDPQTFAIDVTPVNDPPTFTKGSDITANEDAGAQTLNGWATSVSAGAANESGQTLTFHVSTDNDGLFSALPAIDSAGNLTFTTAPNLFGSANVSVYLTDDGGTANDGSDTSGTQTFNITVNSVNDPPSFTKGGDQLVLEDAGLQTANGWATNLSAGPANESGQHLTFLVSTNNDALFAVKPAIDANGNLTYTTAANANGSATVTVRLMDDGGTANGGVDTSAPQTFAINVTPVNDAPSFTKGSDQTMLEDAGPQTVTGWATGISAGAANESGQTITFHVSTSNDSLFSMLPTIDAVGDLSYTSAPNANGAATVSVFLTDNGGTANGGSDTSGTQTFTINITSVNDAPVLDPTGTPVLPFIPVLGKVLPASGPIADLTGFVSDVDAGALKGVAVTAVDTSHGKWQFNLSGAANGWTDITGVSASHALLLAADGTTLIQFVPKKNFTGFASITFKAWDQTDSGTNGLFGDTTNASDTAFSTASDRGWIAVGKTKTVIDPDGDTVLKMSLPVYTATSKVKALTPVMAKDLLGIAGLEAGAAPKGGFGVAIIAADTTNGHWEYKRAKIDKTFQPVAVGAGTILLLRPTDQLRFVPTLTSSDAAPLTFVTWDPTAGVGTAGPSNMSPAGPGFGVEPGKAVLDLTPVLDLSMPAILNPVSAGQTTPDGVTFESMMSPSRIVGSNIGVAVVRSTGQGTWEYKPAGGDWTTLPKVSAAKMLFLDTDTEIRFTASTSATAGSASLSFKAWDKTGVAPGPIPVTIGAVGKTAVSKETEIVTVSVADQPPSLDTTPDVTLPSVSSAKKPGTGVAVSILLGKAFSDLDGRKAIKGIAVTFVDDTNGTWQYSLGANAWVDFGSVSDTSAVLLSDKSKIRFVPNVGFTGQAAATIEYKAWDRTAGEAGDRGVDTTGVLLNMFSVQKETATISVTA
jgi:hypothetical protein